MDLKTTAQYGAWAVSSDADIGGKSKATLQPVSGGANGSKGALQVTGELVPGAAFTWAGVAFHPGASADEAVNLSGKKTLSFWAKGDGKSYAVAVMTESNSGQMPGIQPFVAGPEWKQYTFSWSDFKTDGHDVTAIAFAHAQEPGKFEFELDECGDQIVSCATGEGARRSTISSQRRALQCLRANTDFGG